MTKKYFLKIFVLICYQPEDVHCWTKLKVQKCPLLSVIKISPGPLSSIRVRVHSPGPRYTSLTSSNFLVQNLSAISTLRLEFSLSLLWFSCESLVEKFNATAVSKIYYLLIHSQNREAKPFFKLSQIYKCNFYTIKIHY